MKSHLLVVTTICVFLVCAPIFAQEAQPKIAVIGLSNPATLRKSNLGNALVDILTTQISQAGKYRLIERDALQQVLNELSLGTTDDFDAKEVVKKGGLAGADLLLLGKISTYTYRESMFQTSRYVYPQGLVDVVGYLHIGEVRLDLRVVDVRTGEAIRSVSGNGQSQNTGQASLLPLWKGYLAVEGQGSLSSLSTLLTEAATNAIREAVRTLNDMHPDLVAFVSGRAVQSDLSLISDGTIVADVGGGNFVIGLSNASSLKVGDRYRVISETIIRDSAGKEVYRQKQQGGGVLEVVDVSQKDRAMARLLPPQGASSVVSPHQKDAITLDQEYAKHLRGMTVPASGGGGNPSAGTVGGAAAATPDAARIQTFLARGDRFLSNRNYVEALLQYKGGLLLSAANPDLLARTVVALAGVDNFTDAEETAEKAIEAGGSIVFPVAHNHAFGICEGDFTIQKERVSYQPRSGPDGFVLSSGGLIDISPAIYRGTNLPMLVVRWRAPNGKDQKYHMVLTSYLTRASGGRGIPQIFRASGEAVDKTTRLDNMLIHLIQQNAK